MKVVGSRVPAIDWKQRTSGTFVYAGDLDFNNLLVGRILRSPHAHARIRKLDTNAARAMPGVRAVITFADFAPGTRYLHEGSPDRPPLAEGVVRFVGQEVAAVAAETAEQAQAALRAIVVEYDPLPAALTIDQALKGGAPTLHKRPTDTPNVSAKLKRDWGDPKGGRVASSKVAEGTFWFSQQSHISMEASVTVARWDGDANKMHLWTSTHAPYFVRKEVAHILSIPMSQVVLHEIGIGGGFGSKAKVSEHEAVVAALARAAGETVRIAFTREEEFAFTKTRHGMRTWMRLHADAVGRVRTVDAHILSDNGAYNHSGVSVMMAGLKSLGLSCYQPDGVKAEAWLVDTAKQPGGQFRGYGGTQVAFALESLMDDLAEQFGEDPLRYRIKNAIKDDTTTLSGAEVGTARIVDCLEAVRTAINWDFEKLNRNYGYGVGVATGVHSSGVYNAPDSNRSDGAIDVFNNGMVRVRFGGADPGTGQKTILAQIAAEELSVDLANVSVMMIDTEQTPFDMGAWSSRGTHYGGHAIRKAAKTAAERLRRLAIPIVGAEVVRLDDGFAIAGDKRVAIGDLVRLSNEAIDGVLTTETSYVENSVVQGDPKTGYGNASASYNYAAHAARVFVDVRTGKVTVLDYVAAHDVGTPINPLFVEGQISGGAVMGIGAALGEEMIWHEGKLVTPSYMHYAPPRAADVPRVRSIIVGESDPKGPYGAKAVGECSINPPPAAIANAVYDAIGIRITNLPITPDKIINAIAAKEQRKRHFGLWRRPDRWWIGFVRWLYPRGLFAFLHKRQVKAVTPRLVHHPRSLEAPETISSAIALLNENSAIIAGGSDLQIQRRNNIVEPARLVSIINISALQMIESDESGGVLLGAGVTLARLAEQLQSSHPMLVNAIEQIATPQIRSIATLGGNLIQSKRCWFYQNDFPCFKRQGGLAPCYAITGDHRFYHAAMGGHRCQAVTPSDTATALVAMGAVAIIAGPRGERRVDMSSFYSGPGETVVAKDELLTGVWLPPASAQRKGAYEKLRFSQGDFAIASVALTADIDASGIWKNVHLVIGSIGPTPWQAQKTEARLENTRVTASIVRAELDRELNLVADPLEHNGWKLDAACGLAEIIVDRLAKN